MSKIEDLKDIADHTQRIGRVYGAHDRLSERGGIKRFDYFADLPERLKDLLELAGTAPEPLQPGQKELCVKEPYANVAYGVML